ncbi:MAG: radical SAM family heme chaperone HemW [Verrucomicrobiota bacterium]
MALQARSDPAEALGIYVHVPFCATACDFCAFYQEAPEREAIRRYLETMQKAFRRPAPGRYASTAFWGGGTPGLLRAADLETLGGQMLEVLPAPPAEWTVEMAPSTVKADKLAVLRDLGVTRLSMGVQSFDERMLDRLGRQHSPRQVLRAIDTIHAAGFENLNLDLIFAVPGQSLADWRRDLEAALAVGPTHLSTYCLTFEEDTKLWVQLQRGEVQQRSERDEAAFYETSWEVLEGAGFAQYEVSNYARPGHACEHNLNTWQMQEWLGYGPSAASQFAGRRFTQPSSLEAWTAGLEGGEETLEDEVSLSPALLASDALIFGLRMNAGVDRPALARRFPAAPWAAYDRLAADLAEEGLLEISRLGHWRLTPAGRLVADGVGAAFLE